VVLHQKKYNVEMLEKFDMEEYKTTTTPSKVKVISLENSEEEVNNTLYKQIFG